MFDNMSRKELHEFARETLGVGFDPFTDVFIMREECARLLAVKQEKEPELVVRKRGRPKA